MPTREALENWSPFGFYDVRDQLRRHVYARSAKAFAVGDAARDAVRDADALTARQRYIRETFLECIGGLPEAGTPLKARVTGVVSEPGLRIEKVIFEARPSVFVTANLYVPDGVDTPGAAVLFLCGHCLEGKGYPRYQAVCRHLAAAGLIVMAQDPVGQGERLGYYEHALGEATVAWGTTEHDHAGSQCLVLGYSIARFFLHDAMRGIDYLSSRPDVDPRRIGVTGHSGGGTQTCMLMMADPRVAAAAPGTFLMNRESYLYAGGAQDAEQIWPGFTAAGLDHEDFLIAMAPRPVRVLAAQYDFFPIEGTRRTVERCTRFWTMAGGEDALDMVEDVTTHCYSDTLAHAAAEFFSLHLLGRTGVSDSASVKTLPAEQLWCTPGGQVRAWKPESRFVFEENQARLRARRARSAPGVAEGRRWLEEKVFGSRTRCAENPRFIELGHHQGLRITSGFWWSQEELFCHAFLVRRIEKREQELPVTVALWPGGTGSLGSHWNWMARECDSSRAVLVFEPTGVGALLPNPVNNHAPQARYGVLHKFSDDLCFLGDSLAAIRVWDLVRLLDVLSVWPGLDESAPLKIHAEGFLAVYARLAATLEPRLSNLELQNPEPPLIEWAAQRHYDDFEVRTRILPGVGKFFPEGENPSWR